MTLRPMTMDDADFMLELKNYLETRQYSIVSQEPIKKEDHYKWLEKNLLWFKVMEGEGGTRLGAIRVFGNEISVWVHRGFRSLGVAEGAIRKVMQPRMIAKIVDGNVPSMRAFIKAGFIPVGHLNGYYILEKGV